VTCDLSTLLTLEEAALALGLGRAAAKKRAATRGIGRVFGGKHGVRILTPEDVRELAREIPAHRPVAPPAIPAMVTEDAYQRAERAVEALRERGERS